MINIKQKFILIAIILVLTGAMVWVYDYMAKIEINHISEPVAEEKLQENISSEVIWSQYINDKLGFSIDIPDKAYGQYSCEPKKIIQVPVKVFEDNENGIIYISEEYYYISQYDSEIHKHVGECKKIIEQPRGLKPRLGWAIIIKNAQNENELDEFIKENYGSGCYVKDKKFWETDYEQSGVYDISIEKKGVRNLFL